MDDDLRDEAAGDPAGPEHGADDAEAGGTGADDFEGMLAEELGDSYVPPGEEAESDDDGEEAGAPEAERAPEPRRARSEENVVRRLQASEERVLELERALKEAREAKAPVQFKSTGDLYEDLVSLVTADLGCEADDPRVKSRLFELGGDMLAELNADSEDPKVRARLEKRAGLRREREIQRQIDGLKAENQAKDRELAKRHGIATMTEHLKAADAEATYPHLYAGEDDPVAAVFQGIAMLVESGHRITDANAADTIDYVCRTIDADHRRRLERLEALRSRSAGGKPPERPTQQRQTTRGPLKDGARNRREDGGGRTVTASGVGSRQPPAPKSDVDQNPEDLFERMLREEREERRRLASQRRR